MRRPNRTISVHAERQRQDISNDYQKWKVHLFTGSHNNKSGYGLDRKSQGTFIPSGLSI